MPGNRLGGQRAAKTNKLLYGDDFYHRIGKKGGRASTTGGFYANPELAKRAGAKGGAISRRGEATKTKEMIRKNIDVIIRMVEDKEPVTKISEATGVPKSTLYKLIRTDSLWYYETEVENV